VSAVGRGTRPIVFIASREPSAGIWRGRVPPVLLLSQFATLVDGQLELDHEGVCAAIAEADSAAASRTSTFTVDRLTDLVRRQIRAVDRTQLKDEGLAEAYRREGSYRKAAAVLSEETGREITKDQVAFAVRRLGGRAAVLRTEDSDSVVRRSASPRRPQRRKAAS
jgi:hypothetical protein